MHPLRNDNVKLAQQYQDILLNQEYLKVFSMSSEIAKLAAELRATKNLRTPDAIQVATAIQNGADFFLTNDMSLKSLSNLTVLILDNINAT